MAAATRRIDDYFAQNTQLVRNECAHCAVNPASGHDPASQLTSVNDEKTALPAVAQPSTALRPADRQLPPGAHIARGFHTVDLAAAP